MYTEFLSHWQFIFQYARIIYTRKYNICDCIQHLQNQSGSSNLKRKNYAGDEGLFLCWFWHLSHQVQRRPCGKSAHPTQRVEINWTWTQTGKERASLHGPFPLHSNSYALSKIHGEVQPLPKRHLVKKTQMCIMWGCKSPSWSEGGCVWGKHALACAFGGSITESLCSAQPKTSAVMRRAAHKLERPGLGCVTLWHHLSRHRQPTLASELRGGWGKTPQNQAVILDITEVLADA